MSKMKTNKLIQVQAYLTPEGKPTCCQHYKEGSCFMLRTTRFGTEFQCSLQAGTREYLDRYFDQSKGEYGEYTYLIPHQNCPVWKEAQ